jgi:hypothetical protein
MSSVNMVHLVNLRPLCSIGIHRGSLNTPNERGSDARLGGGHFSGPPCFGPLENFLVFFAKFGVLQPHITLGNPL